MYMHIKMMMLCCGKCERVLVSSGSAISNSSCISIINKQVYDFSMFWKEMNPK